MEASSLQNCMYVIFLASMYAYAALDGFDIGVGCLHLFTRRDIDRRIFINSIGPVWDSNALWVVITAGVLLSGFPGAFATILSDLYIPTTIFLFCFIYRAVAIEFRSKRESASWRRFWDAVFALASFGLAYGLGLVMANLIHGLPINEKGECIHNSCDLFSPYTTILGIFTVLLFMLHGTLYLKLKTEGELQEKLGRWAMRLFCGFSLYWIFMNGYTLFVEHHVMQLVRQEPLLMPFGALGLVALVCLYYSLKKGYDGYAFISSCANILSLVLLFALGTYPNLIRSSFNPNFSLTIYNSSSSPFTLKVVLGMACAGVPLFIFYLTYSYKVFKGKVEIDTMSY